MTDADKYLRPPHGEEEIRYFYGWKPSYLLADATPAREWESENIRYARMPGTLLYAGSPVHTLRVHKRLVERVETVYGDIHRAGLWSEVERYSGAYEFRLKRGSHQLSMHCFGAAIDHDYARNPLGAPPEECFYGNTDEGKAVVRIFEGHGWTWGGKFHGRPDCGHWQFGSGY